MDHLPDPVRGLTFGAAAELYERFRPGYPEDLVDVVVQHARRPVRTAVEVGAGTGKATRLFASRGIAVTAVEPDPEMAQVSHRTTRTLPVRVVVSTFEAFTADDRVDLLYAAAAWHWTDPATRWARAVDLLAPGGVLALFGRPAEPADPAVRTAVEQVESRVLSADDPTVNARWTSQEMAAAPGLTAVVQRDLTAVGTTTADAFVGRLATVSAYLLLGHDARADALRQVRAVLPDEFEIDATTRLTLGRRTAV